MFNQEQLKQIEQTVREFFGKMGVDAEIEIGSPDQDTIPVNLEVDEPKTLIGEQGRTLAKIQHLLKRMTRGQIEDQFYINLDINNYKEKKISYLEQKAREIGDKVALTKKEKKLPPMPPYERRVIHMELADRNDVTTESIGQDPERRVVIKPYS